MTVDELARSLDLETKDCLELLRLFFDATGGDLSGMGSALARGDAPAFERAAHSIRGASLSLGLTELSEAARRGEARAREHHLEELPFLLEEIRRKTASAAEAFSFATPEPRGGGGGSDEFQEDSHP
jgi:HPt (histidine-containing phosphotransfer) domain-containing protein